MSDTITGITQYSLPELKQIMKDNKIKGITIMNKPEIVKLLVERGLISEITLKKPEKIVKEINSKYDFIRFIRNNPKKVVITDLETGIETEYPSIYKASRALGCATTPITKNNGKVWRERYEIKVIDIPASVTSRSN